MNEQHARELLASERKRIETQLADLHIGDHDEDASRQDAGDVAPDLLDAGIEVALDDSLREELAAIERAEQRLAEGTYGLSVESGAPIPDARLEAIPWAERTAEEEARLAP